MRRLDVLSIGLGLLGLGALVYGVFLRVGLDQINAGIWSQALLVGVVLVWLATYLARALTKTMTYNQQLQDYEDAVFQKRLAEMSPEELAQLEVEVEAERQRQASQPPASQPEES